MHETNARYSTEDPRVSLKKFKFFQSCRPVNSSSAITGIGHFFFVRVNVIGCTILKKGRCHSSIWHTHSFGCGGDWSIEL